MLNEWLKIVVPVILSAVGVFIWGMTQDIANIQEKQAEAMVQVHRLDVLETKVERILQEFDLRLKKDSVEK